MGTVTARSRPALATISSAISATAPPLPTFAGSTRVTAFRTCGRRMMTSQTSPYRISARQLALSGTPAPALRQHHRIHHHPAHHRHRFRLVAPHDRRHPIRRHRRQVHAPTCYRTCSPTATKTATVRGGEAARVRISSTSSVGAIAPPSFVNRASVTASRTTGETGQKPQTPPSTPSVQRRAPASSAATVRHLPRLMCRRHCHRHLCRRSPRVSTSCPCG